MKQPMAGTGLVVALIPADLGPLALGVMSALISAALLLVAPHAAPASENISRRSLGTPDIPAADSVWYGIYVEEVRCGYSCKSLFRHGEDAGFTVVVEELTRMLMNDHGQNVTVESIEHVEFDGVSPFAFRSAVFQIVDSSSTQMVDVSRSGEVFTMKVTEDGKSRTLAMPSFKYTLDDVLAFDRWIQTEPVVGDTMRGRGFDFDVLRPETTLHTVLSLDESGLGASQHPVYEVQSISELNGGRIHARVDRAGCVLSAVTGGFEMRRESEEQAREIVFPPDMSVGARVGIDKPLGDAAKVTRLVVEVTGEGASALADDIHQSVSTRLASDSVTMIVTLSLGDGFGAPSPAAPQDVEEALAEVLDYPIKDQAVVELTEEALGNATSPEEKVGCLIRFVDGFVEDSELSPTLSVGSLIVLKKGDYSEHAALFVTLARAAGIPAREIAGLVYGGDDYGGDNHPAFGAHAWAEVVLNGVWVAVDPTWNQTEVDATHIALEHDGKGMGFWSIMSGLSFRLKEVAFEQ